MLHAQPGTIAGTILDQAAKPVPGASVTVKSDGGSVSGTATSDSEGKYSVSGIGAGDYSVEATAPGFAVSTRRRVPSGTQEVTITLNVDAISQSVTVQETVLLAVETAPQGNTLDAMAAKTEISTALIQNFMAPVADFAEVIQQAPNAFSINPNGIGLGQGKSFFRGFQDGQYTITFDGIPFEDTNTPTHHSWASFPRQWISSTDFDRSPGQPHDFGPTNFGGSINLKSPELQADPDIRGTFSYGSFNTRLYSLDFESGLFSLWGAPKSDAVLINVNEMRSDGYQTFNNQKRDSGYGKYQHRFSPRTTLSLYGGLVDIFNNTPDTTNATRAQISKFGDNYLMDGTPCLTTGTPYAPFCTSGAPDGYYFGYEKYHVQTDFEYAHFNTDLGDGWTVDNNAYTTRYWNKQFLVKNFAINTGTTKPSGVDKLNGYRHAGDTFVLGKESKYGVFRAGAWYDWAYTDRYQYPSNPLTHLNTPLPNFHEHFITQSFQPFAEFEWRPTRKLVILAGIKAADYKMNFVQYADNGNKIGCLGGVKPSTYGPGPFSGAVSCPGSPAFIAHEINYNNWLPTLTARYRLWKQWSVYGEFAEGSVIPPSAVFDVPGAVVATPPKPTVAKTYQAGSVFKMNRFTLDVDGYYVHFQNGYASYYDPVALDSLFVATGPSNTRGIEAEGNVALGHGLSIYGNVSGGSAKYKEGRNFPNGGLSVALSPGNIEGGSLLYQHRNWDVGLVFKRVGAYWEDNASLKYTINGASIPYPVNQAVKIQPWDLENFFVNYTIKNSSHFRGTKIQFSINNLADHHSLVDVTPGIAPTAAVHYTQDGSDLLSLLPARSFTVTITGGYAPRR
jgi:iron complex outermembrane receptor protein